MTDEEAIRWCQRHSVIAIFHSDRTVLVLPTHAVEIEAFRERGFKLEIRKGFTLAYTEPGDAFGDVVEIAKKVWREKLSPADQVTDIVDRLPPARLVFKTNM